jgi:hypothetical protein
MDPFKLKENLNDLTILISNLNIPLAKSPSPLSKVF